MALARGLFFTVFCLFVLVSKAHAATLDVGSFSGTVNLNLGSTLFGGHVQPGDTVTGTVSVNTDLLVRDPNSPANMGYIAVGNPSAVVVTETVDGITQSFTSAAQGTVSLNTCCGGNGFSVIALQAYGSVASGLTFGDNKDFLTGLSLPQSFVFDAPSLSENDYSSQIVSGSGVIYWRVDTFSLQPVSTTPLPPTWTMMLAGLAGFGFIAYRRKARPAQMTV